MRTEINVKHIAKGKLFVYCVLAKTFNLANFFVVIFHNVYFELRGCKIAYSYSLAYGCKNIWLTRMISVAVTYRNYHS